MQIENAENATLISKHLNEIERNSVLNLKKDLGRFLKKYNEVLISLRHCTEVRFASFLSCGFTTMAVINPSEKKVAKRTSVEWHKYKCTD